MGKIIICTIGIGDNTWKEFKEEVDKLKSSCSSDLNHSFIPVTLSYLNGGTHVFETDLDRLFHTVGKHLRELLKQKKYQNYELKCETATF
jgi:hypothetical protein